tara:strand:- start:879 stop:1121 length:243 start_codon:yes stop_codon:yes gene_type:complete
MQDVVTKFVLAARLTGFQINNFGLNLNFGNVFASVVTPDCCKMISRIADRLEEFCKFVNYLRRWMFSNFYLGCTYFFVWP